MIIKDHVLILDRRVCRGAVVVVVIFVFSALEKATFFSPGCLPIGKVASGGLEGVEEYPGELGGKNKKENSFHAVSVQTVMFSAQVKRRPDVESLSFFS